MDIYSLTLAAAIACSCAAAISLILRRWLKSIAAVRFGIFASAVAILLDLSSLIFHKLDGHSGGSATPLNFFDFMAQHPAFIVVGLFSVLLLWLSLSRT